MRTCSNCGQQVEEDANFCMSCGIVLEKKPKTTINPTNPETRIKEIKKEKGKMISTMTVIFGAMGFWPLIIIGSIIGLILYIISLSYEDSEFKERARLGLALSVGSLLLYIAAFILLLIVIVSA